MSEQAKKACPFCGLPVYLDNKRKVYIINQNIGQSCSHGRVSIRDDRWNTRPLEDALLARATKAEADNVALKSMVERLIEEGDTLYCDGTDNVDRDWAEWDALVNEWLAKEQR